MSELRPANKMDETILRYADSHSPEEISYMLGGIVSPTRIMSRTAELLKSKNWLDRQQRQQRLYLVLSTMLSNLQDKYLDINTAKVILATVKELFAQARELSATTEDDLNKLYGNQGIIMARVVDKALGYMRGALRDEVPAERWDELMAEALQYAREEIAAYEEIEE